MASQKTVLFVVVFASAMAVLCNAECCGNDGWLFGGCRGNGPCNMFCCNCDGGCNFNSKRSPHHGGHHNVSDGAHHPIVKDAAKLFKDVDKNGDGSIDFKEAVTYASSHDISKAQLTRDPTWFSKMDKNHDGKITPHELDKSLKN